MVKEQQEQDVKVLLKRLTDVYEPEDPDDVIGLLEEAGIDGNFLFGFMIEQGLINDENLPWLFQGTPEGTEEEEEKTGLREGKV